MGENGADAKILVEVVGDTAGDEICARHAGRRKRKIGDDLRRDDGIARLYVEQCEIPFADSAVEFDAGSDRDLSAVEKADVAAEKGNELRSFTDEAKTEIVLIGAFEKEGTLFGKEKREAREIDLARVDFGFGEVSVGGEDGDELRRGFPGDFATGGAS